jgi:hypothetical protein
VVDSLDYRRCLRLNRSLSYHSRTSLRVQETTLTIANGVALTLNVVVMELVAPTLGTVAATIGGDVVTNAVGVLSVTSAIRRGSASNYKQHVSILVQQKRKAIHFQGGRDVPQHP